MYTFRVNIELFIDHQHFMIFDFVAHRMFAFLVHPPPPL